MSLLLRWIRVSGVICILAMIFGVGVCRARLTPTVLMATSGLLVLMVRLIRMVMVMMALGTGSWVNYGFVLRLLVAVGLCR